MPESSSNPSTLITAQQVQLESQRMQDVVLLVDNLLRQEETTLGLIVDCMYDIGSVRLIDKKLNLPFLKGATVRVARVSKPLFRMLALRWIKKNCPELLAKWLYSKVLFEEAPKPAPKPKPEPVPSIESALENPNPIEEISEQISSPPPLPGAVETAIATAETPPMPLPDGSQDAAVGNMSSSASSANSPMPEAEPAPTTHPSTDSQGLDNEPIPATAVAPENQTLNVKSLMSVAQPVGSQAVLSIEPAPPLPLPAITLEEYNRAIAQIKFRDTEITKLRTRSYVLAGLLVAVSVALSGALFWPRYDPDLGIPSKAEPVQSQGHSSP